MRNDWNGFTLIESVIAIGVVSLIVLVLNMLIKVEVKVLDSVHDNSEIGWHVFLSQLDIRGRGWQKKRVTQERIYLMDITKSSPKNEIIIMRYHNQLKLQMNGGYEPLLVGVKTSSFHDTAQGVRFDVAMEDGKKFEAYFPQW